MYKIEVKLTVQRSFVDGVQISQNAAFGRLINKQPVERTLEVAVSGFFSGKNKADAMAQAEAYCNSPYFVRKVAEAKAQPHVIVETEIVKR